MKQLDLIRMEEVQGGGVNWGCTASLGLAVTIWSVGFGMVNPLAGAAIGYLGGLAVSYACDTP